MNGHWIAVAAAEHVRRGLSGGFMQVCHGKGAPLQRIKPGDHVIYYSPTATFGGLDRLQAFTAIGRVRDKEPYRADMGNGFQPFRRDVDWLEAQEAPIRTLLEQLHLTAGQRNWGYQLRFGLLRAEAHDFEIIASAMSAHAVSAVSL
ncbi:EVE domain-containing protein [Bosea sp. OK403]|uniref:EVE domain-containing protein n=1 Tax=Bosea sp. OK403 TaxID=1855286 RepID=UPI0008ED5E2B|nr:EVE domain-containing protein [Bosea sp. OK403]SFI10306.1 EVE domain-containing protein [Bosea sp. OK403]